MRKFSRILVVTAALSLQGCVLLAAAGAGAAATAVVVNERRPIQTVADDKNIELTANTQIVQSPMLSKDTHIVIAAFNHAVLLAGQAPDEVLRHKIELLVESLPKVSRVYNQLEIAPPTSPAIRSNDAWITAKVKTEMLRAKDLNSGQIKVITENGSVYLIGIVSHYQADLAADVTRRVNGVKRVVKLFEYTYAS